MRRGGLGRSTRFCDLDHIEFKFHVNISAKTKKGRAEPDININSLDLLDKADLTWRIVTSVVHSWYDIAELEVPITTRLIT